MLYSCTQALPSGKLSNILEIKTFISVLKYRMYQRDRRVEAGERQVDISAHAGSVGEKQVVFLPMWLGCVGVGGGGATL